MRSKFSADQPDIRPQINTCDPEARLRNKQRNILKVFHALPSKLRHTFLRAFLNSFGSNMLSDSAHRFMTTLLITGQCWHSDCLVQGLNGGISL